MERHFSSAMLSGYLDGRIGGGKADTVKAHLSLCAACRRKYAALEFGKKILSGAGMLEVSEGFDSAFYARLDKVMARREEAGIIERFTDYIKEGVGTALTTPLPAFAKVIAIASIVIAVGVGTACFKASYPIDVLAVAGKAEVYLEETGRWVELKEGMRLAQIGAFRTGGSGYTDLGVPGIFTIRMKGDAEITALSSLPRFGKGLVSYEVARGEVLINITERFKGSRFDLFTPQARAEALGTSFKVNVSEGKEEKTSLAVLQGKVRVENRYPLYAAAQSPEVIVAAGQKTEVSLGKAPEPPSPLIDKEWREIVELYQLDARTQVTLFISMDPARARELLKPCAIYIYDPEPRMLSGELEKAIENVSAALANGDPGLHSDAISHLEALTDEHPEESYNAPLKLFIGAYYAYISRYNEAIETFEEVRDEFPDSQFASLAICAKGIVSAEKLGDYENARAEFEDLLKEFPDGPDAEEAKRMLGLLEEPKT